MTHPHGEAHGGKVNRPPGTCATSVPKGGDQGMHASGAHRSTKVLGKQKLPPTEIVDAWGGSATHR